MTALISISDFSVTRGSHVLLSGLGFELHAGEVVVVLGPNGAGKSSLLLALAGLIPCSGSVELLGRPVAAFRRTEMSQAVAWQGELPPTEFGLTVRQRLELAAGEACAAVDAVAAAMDVALLLHRPLGELSSGERQRVELAALMLRNTPIWLLDEPTAHLDLKHQMHCIRMMREQRGAGRAMVVVLHDLQQAMAVADHLILIDGKGGAEYGEARKLFADDRLSRLFDAPLCMQGSLLVPDYGEQR